MAVSQRTISRLSVVIAIVAIVVIAVVYSVLKGADSPKLQSGTPLDAQPAPAFQLTDQNGASVAFPQQFRGHPVVLTFMYTHCQDVCPLTASKLAQTAHTLGTKADEVAWLAVSVDPVNDTPDAVKQFVQDRGLTGRLRFLLGTSDQLAPVWRDYHGVSERDEKGPDATPTPLHLTGWVIDKQGRERVVLNPTFDPKLLASDLSILLNS